MNGCLLRHEIDKIGLNLLLVYVFLLSAHDADKDLQQHDTTRNYHC